MRHATNPEIATMLPTELVTSREIHPSTEGVIDKVKFFQLGAITYIINKCIDKYAVLCKIAVYLTSGFDTADPHLIPPINERITAL